MSSAVVDDEDDHPERPSKLYGKCEVSKGDGNVCEMGKGSEGVAGDALEEDDTLSDLRSWL